MLDIIGYRILSSSLLSKNLKIKIYRTIILPVLNEYETWSLTMKEKHRMWMFENRVLRRILDLRGRCNLGVGKTT